MVWSAITLSGLYCNHNKNDVTLDQAPQTRGPREGSMRPPKHLIISRKHRNLGEKSFFFNFSSIHRHFALISIFFFQNFMIVWPLKRFFSMRPADSWTLSHAARQPVWAWDPCSRSTWSKIPGEVLGVTAFILTSFLTFVWGSYVTTHYTHQPLMYIYGRH